MKKLRILILLLAIAIIGIFSFSMTACNEDIDFVFQKIRGKDEYCVVGVKDKFKVKNIKIPNTYNGYPVTEMSESFFNLPNLKSIHIPSNIKSILFPGDSDVEIAHNDLKSITVSSDNLTYTSIDGNLYSKDGKTLVKYARGKTDTKFIVPEYVTSIGEFAFLNSNLAEIIIPNTVTNIGRAAFRDCLYLTSIEIPNSITKIESYLFYRSALKNIIIPDSVTCICSGAFGKCTILSNIELPNSVTRIENSVFNGAVRLTSIVIPNSVTYIGDIISGSKITSIFYKGTKINWKDVYIYNPTENLIVYSYSETEPELSENGSYYNGNYWRYVDGVPTPWIKE